MISRYILAAAALTAIAIPAAAIADPFNGPFLGAQAGLNHDKVRNIDSDVGPFPIDRSRNSANGAVFAGYDYKISPRVVIGTEAGFSIGADDALSQTRGNTALRVNPRYAFDLSARAGYLLNDTTLVYVRGGYQNVDVRTSSQTGAARLVDTGTMDGWMAGGGIERAIAPQISARLEYRYSDLSGNSGKYDRQQGLVGIAYHF
jgi:outer membrane immunogenic protein